MYALSQRRRLALFLLVIECFAIGLVLGALFKSVTVGVMSTVMGLISLWGKKERSGWVWVLMPVLLAVGVTLSLLVAHRFLGTRLK